MYRVVEKLLLPGEPQLNESAKSPSRRALALSPYIHTLGKRNRVSGCDAQGSPFSHRTSYIRRSPRTSDVYRLVSRCRLLYRLALPPFKKKKKKKTGRNVVILHCVNRIFLIKKKNLSYIHYMTPQTTQ